MHIEEQTLSLLKPGCILPTTAIKHAGSSPVPLSPLGAFPFTVSPKHLHDWVPELRDKLGLMLYDLEHWQAGSGIIADKHQQVCGAYMAIDCTEFADRTIYPSAWEIVEGTEADILDALPKLFKGRGGRILHLATKNEWTDPDTFSVIAVPNYGPAARAWWWGTRWKAEHVSALVHGTAEGFVKADGISKKITSLVWRKNGLYAFVMNERKPGAWFAWEANANLDVIFAALDGNHAVPGGKVDHIPKRILDFGGFHRIFYANGSFNDSCACALEHADGAPNHALKFWDWESLVSTLTDKKRRIVRLRQGGIDDQYEYHAITTNTL
jgi:hypothetical protein